jgi:flagellar export protein FliJ
MRFRFRLERMLRFLELREAVKKTETAALVQRLKELEARRETRQRTIQEVLGNYQRQLESGNQWVPYQVGKIQADSRELIRLEEDIHQTKLDVTRTKDELARIAMRRKALANLKEKRYAEFRLSESRLEQKRLDEMYRLVKGK